jgi:CheY-like chemotaxis protein
MGECVLVVDDEPHSREMHAEALRVWGYESVVAQDGFEALQKVSEHSPDLVISDLHMPRMSGFELLSVLRRRYPKLPLICISGEDGADVAQPHVACNTLLWKGRYDLAELRTQIAELLRGEDRAAHLKTQRTVVWVPKDPAGHYIVSCTNCLRSFPVPGTTEKEHAEQHTPCPHCHTLLSYFIEGARS